MNISNSVSILNRASFPFKTSRYDCFIFVFIAFVICWYYATYLGQDNNWDQSNYHLLIPFLILQGDFWDNLVPSGVSTYQNPGLLFPAYVIIRHLPPIAATLVLASMQAIAFVIAIVLCRDVVRERGLASRASVALAVLLIFASPIALSEVGTTFTDLLNAAVILLAYRLLMSRSLKRTAVSQCAVAGLLLGAITALKLTNMVFVVGVLGLLLFGAETWRTKLRLMTVCFAAVAVGVVVIGGYWYFLVWQRFGNPIFPFFNAVFQSPDFAMSNFKDHRFDRHSIWAFVTDPIDWAVGRRRDGNLLTSSSEVYFRDARLLMVVAGSAVLAIVAALRPSFRRRLAVSPSIGLVVAWATVFLVWLYLFGIHRYVVALELGAGPVLLILAMQLPGRWWRVGALGVACLVSAATIRIPSWGRVPFTDHWRSIETAPVINDAKPLVFLWSSPLGYVGLSFPNASVFVGLTGDYDMIRGDNTGLWRRVDLLADPAAGRTPFILTIDTDLTDTGPTMRRHGLAPTQDCRGLSIGGTKMHLCRLERMPPV